jgi:ribosomal protein S18 acetylase RimI-like enzyme
VADVVRPYESSADEPWATGFLDEHIGGRRQARGGEIIDVLAPGLGFVAEDRTGLLTYRVDHGSFELTAIVAHPRGRGTGTSLVDALAAEARRRGASRIWLVTTNDNLDAMAFYRRRGFRIAGIRRGAVDEARRVLKPAIPLVGQHGIEMHDEVDVVMDLRRDSTEPASRP